MSIFLNIMRSALMASKTMSAVGVTIVITYGIIDFVRKQHSKRKELE